MKWYNKSKSLGRNKAKPVFEALYAGGLITFSGWVLPSTRWMRHVHSISIVLPIKKELTGRGHLVAMQPNRGKRSGYPAL